MTHRVFSRNASSSRAIPVKKQIQMVIDNPAIPLAFTKNKAGMQGGDPLTEAEAKCATEEWLLARDRAVEHAGGLAALEVHKQYANRILEPFAHITVVCTATDWDNFFALRCHEMAQPEIHALADKMYELYISQTPTTLNVGEWHLPFVSQQEVEMEELQQSVEPRGGIRGYIRKSVARCARVSYLNHEGKEPSFLEDFELYTRLVGSEPIHASPAEHQAMAIGDANVRSGIVASVRGPGGGYKLVATTKPTTALDVAKAVGREFGTLSLDQAPMSRLSKALTEAFENTVL
ncbi:unnamed protein product [Sphagnum balticum]